MNPALPLLALLAVGGAVLLRRRDLGIPWAVVGLAGIGLLAPALARPTGVLSPAATLGAVAPWQGTPGSVDPSRGNPVGNPVLRDVTFQIEPWLLFLRRELRAGRLPFWNPHQFSGAPFWANGQSAPLFPLHLLFAALPVGLGLNLLPWLRLVLGGCGAWALARELGRSRPASLLAALIFPLAGMTVSFLLFPMGNALALLPWVLWAVERIAQGAPGGALALGIAGGLQLLAGHPETAAHAALLSAVYLAARGVDRPAERTAPVLRAWAGLAAGWGAAALAAGVEIVPLAFALPWSSRWQLHLAGPEPPLALLAEQPLRLVLPQLYGHPAAGTWWGPFNYSATAVYAGALALPLAAAGLAGALGAKADRRLRGVGVLLVFSFLAAYHLPGLREALGALPVVGRAPLHRLLAGVELGLALLAAAGLDRWLAGKGRGLLAGAGLVACLLAASWALFGREWAARGLLRDEAAWTAVAAGAALLLALSLRLPPARRSAWSLALPAFAILDLLAAHGAINPGLALAQLYPETGAVRFLAARRDEGRVAGTGAALRPNAAMVYGLADPRGDDPVKIARYEAVYGTFAAASDPVYFQPIARWGDPWLDRLGLRWVLAGPAEPPPVPGWRAAYAGPDARVYERPGALPLVRWESGGSGEAVRVVRREPGAWEIAWRSVRPDRLVIAETAVAGWEAALNGRPLPVATSDGLLLAVPLQPGAGTVSLSYRPPGLALGLVASLLGALALAGLAVGRRAAS